MLSQASGREQTFSIPQRACYCGNSNSQNNQLDIGIYVELKGNTSCFKNCFELLLKDFSFIYCLLSRQAEWSQAPLALMNRGTMFLGNFTNEDFLIEEIVCR